MPSLCASAGAALYGRRRQAARRAGEAAVLAERHVAGPATMAEGGIQQILADLGATVRVRKRRSPPTKTPIRRLEAARHGARPLRRHRRRRTSATATSPSASRHVSVDARPGRRAAALRPDARADQDRHAVARRAPRLQHAGNDAQRIARRHAGRRRHRPRAAGHAPRRASSIRRCPIATWSWAACA